MPPQCFGGHGVTALPGNADPKWNKALSQGMQFSGKSFPLQKTVEELEGFHGIDAVRTFEPFDFESVGNVE